MRVGGMGKAAPGFLAVAWIGLLAAPGPGQEARKELTGPEKIVQQQVEAYNRHDIEAFLKTYSPDNRLFTYPDQETGVGLESMRATYGKMFADNPKLVVKIARRIVQGEYVIDHEQVDTGGLQFAAVAIYRVKDDKIIEVRLLK